MGPCRIEDKTMKGLGGEINVFLQSSEFGPDLTM
jgi:hypothetical protein